MTILSPLTDLPNTTIIDAIKAEEIIAKYKNEMNVDVSSSFSGIKSISIVKCNDTDYKFYYPYNILGDEFFYDQLKIQLPLLYNTPYYPEWKWEYDICINYIKRSDNVYDIGCGVGNFLHKLKEKGVQRVNGTELNQDSVDEAVKRGLNVECVTIQHKALQTSEEYDVVCAFQVLEHIADVKSFLESSIKILKKGGTLMIAVPYSDPYLFRNDKLNTLNMPPHHMGLWNKVAFKNLNKYFPIELDEIIIERLPSTGYDFDQYYKINKDVNYKPGLPFKSIFDRLYFRWLKKYHQKIYGKNIIAIFKKNR